MPYSPPRAIRPKLPLETVLTRLATLSPERCAIHLQYLAAPHDGVYWRNWSATRVEARIVGRKQALALRFTAGDVVLSVSVPPLQKPAVEQLLAAWDITSTPRLDVEISVTVTNNAFSVQFTTAKTIR